MWKQSMRRRKNIRVIVTSPCKLLKMKVLLCSAFLRASKIQHQDYHMSRKGPNLHLQNANALRGRLAPKNV
jgi:hypothetical protein